jgi:hypothetical protein
MRNQRNDARNNYVRMELKYCERCGGLWLRECGSGLIYCVGCESEVSELPILKKRPQTVILAVGRRPAIDDCNFDACARDMARQRSRGGAA